MSKPRIASPARIALAVSLLAVTCCQTPEPPPPAPAPAPPPVAAPAPAPEPVPVEENWIDRPQTAGDWSYLVEPDETLAVFGTPGTAKLVIACDLGTREVGIVRPTLAPMQGQVAMRISTETISRPMLATPASNAPARVMATLDARDPLLDAMAITRGRFAVEVEGQPGLYVPAWAEVTRIIEDCR
ncbi:hypothetical protein [Alteriqipengyuania lutimaris]|uniref:Uncharacterized protein n=1 Tax=Alteriqipengyuania lutimaris TaxID=1538146 RepID=A0A395LGD9_9SPHN|nr:hypothetical protein [Alteriqipengyuania lutimaris]MBB3035350.1 hypothetical protein [Alteriqipengyuania lutimaris]RDS75936.1 hypothetical protein DL238_14770 [Alteriqipengyuania lutimaris]